RLRSSKTASGSDSYGTAGVVTLLTGPLGALVKGKDVEVPAGTEFTIYIDGDRKVVQRGGKRLLATFPPQVARRKIRQRTPAFCTNVSRRWLVLEARCMQEFTAARGSLEVCMLES